MRVPQAIVAQTLRAAGRQPCLPFCIDLADGRRLHMQRLLRVLPGKRVVGDAEIDGRRVLAKLFVGARCARHWQQEVAGLAALRLAALPTPEVFAATALAGGGYALLTAFLEPAESLAESWERLSRRSPDAADALALLAPAVAMLGRLHAAGLVHDDLHLGNFLRHDGQLFVIDGDAVRVVSRGVRLPWAAASSNLAVLLAQLPPDRDGLLPTLLAAYGAGSGQHAPDVAALRAPIEKVRAWRLRDFLAKSVRDCSLFAVERSGSRFSTVLRGQADVLAPLLASPDSAISAGEVLKDGGTSTVARVVVNQRALLIKRYNLKNLRHALGRLWRPSRAWHSWRAAHLLRFFAIPTPAPLALIEERFGPLRRRAWLISEYCHGENLLRHLSADCEPPGDEARALLALFASLRQQRISHGDLKATNLLWDGEHVQLIDLDAVAQHRSAASYARAWRRDRARLLRNWPSDCVLHRWLARQLPAA